MGIPTDEFVRSARPFDAGRQQRSNWCWAAAIQMVLNFHGIPVQQAAIVANTFGRPIDRPGTGSDILDNLNGRGLDVDGRPVSAHTSPLFCDAQVVEELAARRPMIVALKGDPTGTVTGHAYVLTGAYFHRNEFGAPVIDGVVLRNPWPSAPSREEMSAEEFRARFDFGTRIDVQRG